MIAGGVSALFAKCMNFWFIAVFWLVRAFLSLYVAFKVLLLFWKKFAILIRLFALNKGILYFLLLSAFLAL